jgi:hypothetical protein
MLLPLAAAVAAPTPTPDGATVLDPCLVDPGCEDSWRPLLAETMLESGYTFTHEPVLTSAFGAKGTGLVAELELGSAPLGPPNDLQAQFPVVPALPSLAVGYQLGSYTYETPFPQIAFGVHGLAPVGVGDVQVWSMGATTSAALPVSPLLWLGGELAWTWSSFSAPITTDVGTLENVGSFLVSDPLCTEPCVDRFEQQAPRARIGLSVEPVPAVFAWGKIGGAALVQRLDLAVDGSSWRWQPVVPEVSAGLGLRAGDRFQLAVGSTSARRPDGASVGSGIWMTRVIATTGFRFGDVRYHERE